MPRAELVELKDAMHMNRQQRRALAKANKIGKIPGATMPYINPARALKKQKQKEQENLNGMHK